MIFEFYDLTEEEKKQLYALKEEYPEECSVRDVVAGFDGNTVLQLAIDFATNNEEYIQNAFKIIAALIAGGAQVSAAKKTKEATQKAAELTAEATQKAAEITANATREAAEITAEATREAAEIIADATREAARITAEASHAATSSQQSVDKPPKKERSVGVILDNGDRNTIQDREELACLLKSLGYEISII